MTSLTGAASGTPCTSYLASVPLGSCHGVWALCGRLSFIFRASCSAARGGSGSSSSAARMAHTTAFPKSFNLYYGFGDALEVLDDRELLASMANLKQRALSPKRAAEAGLDRAREEEEQGGSSNFAPAPPVNSRPQSAAPRKGTQGRPSRPSSAPPKRPQQQPARHGGGCFEHCFTRLAYHHHFPEMLFWWHFHWAPGHQQQGRKGSI